MPLANHPYASHKRSLQPPQTIAIGTYNARDEKPHLKKQNRESSTTQEGEVTHPSINGQSQTYKCYNIRKCIILTPLILCRAEV